MAEGQPTEMTLEKLKRKRGIIRGLTTKLIQKVQDLLQEELDVNEAKEVLDQLLAKQTMLLELDKSIEPLINDIEELDSEVIVSEEYKEKIIQWKGRITRALEVPLQTDRQESSNRNNSITEPLRDYRERGVHSQIKLPRLTLDKFYGDISNWQNFWSQFESSIHNNRSLNGTEKFNYLKSYLGGTALNSVNGLALTDANYETATGILKERFGKRDLIINAHVSKLLKLKPVKNSGDVKALRMLYDECVVQVRSLENVGVSSDTYGSLLSPILLNMLPDDIVLEFNKINHLNDEWNVNDCLSFLRKEVESRERVFNLTKGKLETVDKTNYNKQKTVNVRYEAQKPRMSSAATLATTVSNFCVFCGKKHKPENCELSVEERKERLMKQGRCYACLGSRHISRYCKNQSRNCNICGRRHHTTLCDKTTEPKPSSENLDNDTVISTVSPHSLTPSKTNTILLQTATAMVKGSGTEQTVRCLLDAGSQRSFIRRDISKALCLPVIGKESLVLHTFGDQRPVSQCMNRVKLKLVNVHDNNSSIELEVLETANVSSATIQVPGSKIEQEMHRRNLRMADINITSNADCSLSILIGADHYWSVVTGKTVRLNNDLVAIETVLGWCVQGPSSVSEFSIGIDSVLTMKVITQEPEIISEELRKFWEIESLGISEKQQGPTETEVDTLKRFESTIKFDGERYEVEFPWKDENGEIFDNRNLAEKRFLSLLRKFKHNPVLYDQYSQVISEQIDLGIVEELTTSDAVATNVNYVPHHAVLKEDKHTTKVRIVFDASAKESGHLSLNDRLNTGPNLNPNLLTLLTRFRTHKVAFTADIEKAFLQISLAPKDRNSMRFLWITDPINSLEPEIKVYRMTRVPFGTTASPFLLAGTLRHHLKKYEPIAAVTCDLISESLYVDDLIAGTDTDEDGIKVTKEAKEIMQNASMNLRKWRTNSTVLRNWWTENEFDQGEKYDTVCERHAPLKVLGLAWNCETDEISFDLSGLQNLLMNRKDTKRYVLQAVARIFDPIGFLSPYTIRAKCFFQQLWERGLSWDEVLPDDLKCRWKHWCMDLPTLRKIVVKRGYFSTEVDELITSKQLHVFCDSSESAYGTAAYLRYETSNGSIKTSFVSSKSRVAPLKKLTFPRLELMATLLGARIAKQLKMDLKLNGLTVHLWTDSSIVLHWIRGSAKVWKPFVSNRVSEIQTLSDPDTWRHCPGIQNPADLLTRGMPAEQLIKSRLWWEGPDWIQEPEEKWPQKIAFPMGQIGDYIQAEAKMSKDTVIQVVGQSNLNSQGELFELSRYNSLTRVLRITAWIKRFLYNASRNRERKSGPLIASEILDAEKYWELVCQRVYIREMKLLQQGKPVTSDSKIVELNPIIQDGILCVGGRLQMSNLKFHEKHPKILPPGHKFTELQVKHAHEKTFHSGVTSTLSQLRENYWIPRGRQIVKTVIRNCLVCKKYRATPGKVRVAPLPKDRITEADSFSVCGIDFAGPVYSKTKNGSNKCYIALFICSVTRAVHLELVSDLTTEKFLLALRRFIGRRGLCTTIYSDNAKTFKRANQDLKDLWNLLPDPAVAEYFGNNRITWKFIVEKGAWWGGHYERMVRTIKTCLRKKLGRISLEFEELETLLVEIEAVINSRPLTYTYNEAQEPVPLAPSHFLIGRRLLSFPPIKPEVDFSTINREKLTRRLIYRQRLINGFWERWKKEYILDLRSLHHSKVPKEEGDFKPGDVVIVHEDKTPKHMWKLARVLQVYPGRDNRVRAVRLKVSNGKELRRPIQLLSKLELS